MNKQEAIKTIERDKIQVGKFTEITRDVNAIRRKVEMVDYVPLETVVSAINKINEQQKPVVPKFVAEWIENHKGDYNEWNREARADFVFRAIYDVFRFGEGLNTRDFTIDEKFSEWTTKNAYEFIIAILLEYTIEQEKLYTVEIPNPKGDSLTVLEKFDDDTVVISQMDVFPVDWRNQAEYQLTESEIKKDFDFLWQFKKEVE